MARTERWLEKLSNRLVAVITLIYQPYASFACDISKVLSYQPLFCLLPAFVLSKMGGEFIPRTMKGT